MSWDIISAGASLIPGGGIVTSLAGSILPSVFGASTSKAATEDARAIEAGGYNLDVYALAEVFRRGSFLGRSMSSWSGAKANTQDARQFFRVVAAAVGAIDGGYRKRGDSGNQAALAAAESWAYSIDRTAGTSIGPEVRGQDPANFIRKVSAIQPPAGSPPPTLPATVPPTAPPPGITSPSESWSVGGAVQLGSGRPNTNLIVLGVVATLLVVVSLLLRGR